MKSIIRRYNRALENVVDARIAFDRLNTAAPAHCVAGWESSIDAAELDRNSDPSAMDIMHLQFKSGLSLKEITAEIMREDSSERSLIPDNGDNTEWLLEGLHIEDEQ